ncbi:DEAD/DEAH box helicase [Demequina sp. SO4-13]|uniref:DEAD/DEAH box helicase n=1 Tax=Demequina sp. SO4-13 TaxID=3401027 RepID=UPI003AF7BB4A
MQSATIADALAGRDVLARARTGSGKTLGFGLPAIAQLAESGRATPHRPRAVVLVPTRELAMQVNDALEPYAHSMHVSLRLVAGGLSMSKQILAIERGVHLVIATPGRLADLVRRGHADLSETRIVVLDEADHMAQMGFMDEIEEILERVPHGAQRLFFSATLDGDVDRLVSTSMTDPARHDVTGGDDDASEMSHIVLHVPPHAKYQLATRVAARDGRTIVFVRSKLGCDRIAAQMRDAGVTAVALHGDKSQAERNHAITGFRAGTIPVLVATDVAARGIHVDHVDLVMQMDPPADHKDYTHRAGRTARAGERGMVVTLALPHQRRTVEGLMDSAGVDATITSLRGDDAASLTTLAQLTGAQEPSGVPVPEPVISGGKRDSRPERGARSARPSRGDRGRRPTHGRAADTAPTPQHESAKARHELERRERELQARERELALREQRLGDRGSSTPAQAAAEASEKSGRPARKPEGWAKRSPKSRDSWARKSGGTSGKRKRDERLEEPGRARDERFTRGRGESTGRARDDRARDDRPSRGRDERPNRTRDERPSRGRDERPNRTRDERPSRGRDERTPDRGDKQPDKRGRSAPSQGRATGRGADSRTAGRDGGERSSRAQGQRSGAGPRSDGERLAPRAERRRALQDPEGTQRPGRPDAKPSAKKAGKKGKGAPATGRSGKPRPKKKR